MSKTLQNRSQLMADMTREELLSASSVLHNGQKAGEDTVSSLLNNGFLQGTQGADLYFGRRRSSDRISPA
jgi:hypothetical protein